MFSGSARVKLSVTADGDSVVISSLFSEVSESTLAYGSLAVWVAEASLLTASPALSLAWHGGSNYEIAFSTIKTLHYTNSDVKNIYI